MATLSIKSVLLLDGIDKVCGDKLSEAGISVTVKGKLSKEELLGEIKVHDAVVVRSATKVTAEVLSAGAPRLQLVGRAGTGTDNIDVEAATRQGVIVMNTPGGNTLSAAEHTCALICSLGRFLPLACASLKAGAWDRKKFLGNELYGKTLAIVGLGRIGREVATRMQSFGMKTIGYDPFVDVTTAAQWNIEAMELEQLWPKADYITVHTPLLPHTRNLVGEEVLLKKCKRGVKVINVARGGIVDEVALLKALDDGACAGAGLDVFLNEPPTDFTLCQHPKVICTPHLGANTAEAQKRVAEEIAEQIVTGSNGGPLTGLVNAQAMAGGAAAQPWLQLAIALGQMAAVVRGTNEGAKIEVKCFGKEVSTFARSIGSGALTGFLKAVSKGVANLVNAAQMAADHNVNLQGSSASKDRPELLPPSVAQSIQLSVTIAQDTTVLLGSVANGLPLLYTIDDCEWQTGVPLRNHLSLYSCTDKASPLAAISTAVVATGASICGLWLSTHSQSGKYYIQTSTTGKVAGLKDIHFASYLGQLEFVC